MSTSVKPVNLDDVAIQYYVLSHCGLNISATYLVHINRGYVRQGEIDVQQLFKGESVLDEAQARQGGLPQQITDLREALRGGEPTINIGPHCRDPYDCDYIPYCWQHIPENSIFDLSGRGINKFEYYRRGFIRLEDLPLDDLNKAQRFQAEATLQRTDTTNIEAVREFLDTLWYPLYHLDFETVNDPIPTFDGTRPYQQVPFQYSLHLQEFAGEEPDHYEYLAAPGDDPRRTIAERLVEQIPADACVLTYNQTFEKGVLRALAELFPDLAEGLLARVENVRDLMVPFRKRDVYRWPMAGSYSIKAVLPAMVSELSYKGMAVADGQMAMVAFREMCLTDDPERVAEIRRGVLEYCELDTLAMVRILEEMMGVGECV